MNMIDDSDTGNMVKTRSICNVTELQALLFQPCRTAGTYLSSFLQNTLKTNQVEINTDNKTLKPVAKLKEPRDLFALPKELDCSQQAARWPSECQVLEERVQHIEYVPPAPELYYQPTGKEIQPKPVGEEAGTIVFQYYPMSAVNYFSRSSVGGSRYFLPACPVSKENDDDLKFESRFESGNLAKVVKITETYYELYLRTDMYTNRHMQWFYFRIQNTKKHIIYRFSFVNLSKGDSLYSVGMKPLLYSTKDAQLSAVGWRRCGDNITYYKNDPVSEEEDETPNYTLSFNIEFPHDQDEVYLAHCYPYTYTDLQDYLNKLQNHPVKSNFTKLRLLCRTLAGNNVYYVTITEPPVGDEPKKKKAVVVTARVHPGETPSSWMMKGLIDFLTGDTDQAKELREKFIFKLVPMLNPDGVIVGNNRCSLTGRDLNRQYRTVIRETYPPVWHTKLMIRRLMEECGIVMYCDLHAHSRKHNVFIYGCENKRYLDRRLQEQVFPLMLHKNAADKFSFENCKFRIQRSKEGTGRVVVWMMGVANSYTMEASFAGSTLGSRVDTHFNIQDFESMGKAFCETLLDFCDEEPSKEKLRLKIIERLVKEGSSADEPTNINLSDYSSDEGDSSSCSGDGPILNKNNSVWNEEGPRSLPEMVPHRPPSSTLPKKETTTKLTTRVSSAKIPKKVGIVEKTPPLPRKPLQVHKTTLDPPCLEANNDGVDVNTTEIDSGDESASWQKGIRKLKVNERGKKMKKRRMPPELIVTPAQVLETSDICDKVVFKEPKKKVAQTKRKNLNGDSRGEKIWLWHHAKCIQTNSKTEKSISDLTTEVRLKMGTSLKQRIWMGCPCEANQVPLSKGSSLTFTHWTKGPLSWASNFLSQPSNETKSYTPKQPIQEKVQKLMTGQAEEVTIATSRRKSHTKKTIHTQEQGNHSEHQRKSSQRSRTRSQKNVKQLSFHMGNDPVSQVALLKLSDSSSTKSHNRKSGSKAEDNVASKTSKFRKSGLVVAAVSRRRYGNVDSDSEKNITEKIVHSKKKKRKTSTLKKTKCIHSPAKSESSKFNDN